MLCAHSLTKQFLQKYVTNQFGVVHRGQNHEDERDNILRTKILSGTVILNFHNRANTAFTNITVRFVDSSHL